MATGWQPATGLERALLDAIGRADQDEYLRLLRGVGLLVPVQQDAAGRTVGWVTTSSDGRTYLLGYTSQEGLSAAAAGQQVPCVRASLQELAQRWPDPTWWFAVNSGLPIEALLPPEYVTSLATDSATPPGSPAATGVAA
ncbi:MAG: SseB family protein, partial [Micromonosporaceae bacterium]